MQFTPAAQAHADQATAALQNGDTATAHHHLDAIHDHGTDTDRLILAVIIHATQQHRTAT